MKKLVRATVDSRLLVERVQEFIDKPARKFSVFQEGNLIIEKHSIQSLINNYIRYDLLGIEAEAEA